MRVSLRWLREHLGDDLKVDALLANLNDLGLEIDETVDLGMRSGLIVVGQIKSIGKHPEADKLTLCQVDVGKPEPLSIVCGATNQKAGDKVPVALVGATLPSGTKLRAVKIRGVASEGMLCSGTELGWSDDASGILILPEEWKVGEPFDFLFEVSITANRPDCMSVFGLARDLAALHRKKIYLHAPRVPEQAEHVEQIINVAVKDREACSRYCARVIRGVRVGPSPLWLVRALESVGLRSINNVVDVTNCVLMECGHPLHAFDADRLTDRKITVRRAERGESFKALDGTDNALDEEDLVIADAQRVVALAGVIGGANSEVIEATSTVVLEAAHFDPVVVRRASVRHGISTDSSQRFERGADRAMVLHAINRATQLIRDLCGGEVARGTIDLQPVVPEKPPTIPLRLSRVKRLIGIDLPHTEIADLLVHLGCEIPRFHREQFFVNPPTWRVDLTREADLIEEIARLHGYGDIPTSLPAVIGQPRRLPPLSEVTAPLSETLIAEGLREAVNFSFMAEEIITAGGHARESLVTVKNPLSRDHATMRPALLPGLLVNVAGNLNRGADDLRLFEIGTVYQRGGDRPEERQELAAVLAGAAPATWQNPEQPHDFPLIKGIAEQCLRALGLHQWQVKPLDDPRYHPHRAATLCQGPHVLARLGELHPDLLDAFDIEQRVCALEMTLAPLAERVSRARRHVEISRQPSVRRDLALVVAGDVTAGDLTATVTQAAGDLLEGIRLFDIYQGEHIEEGKKSMAFALTFRAADRTLREEEVQEITDQILSAAAQRHSAALRG